MEIKHKDYAEFGIDIPYGRRSGTVKAICPKCHDQRSNKRDKSLSVNLDKGVWHCHYCNWSGTNEVRVKDDWTQKSMTRKDDWQQRSTIRKQKKVYKLPTAQASEEQRHQVGAKALAWFASRGISEQTLRALNVTEGMEWMPQTNKPENTVQFNYYRGEELVPATAPDHLDDVPAGAAEVAFQLLDDLAVAAHWAVQTLQVAVDDEGEVVQLLVGGQLRKMTWAAVGARAAEHFGTMRPDIAFIGANGIEAHFGISTPGMNEAIVKTAICKAARRVVLLCDSAKFGQESLVRFAGFEDIDTLITDREPEGALRQALEAANVEIVIA